ncbi:MAG: MarR family transcriptional regulator [Clostridia bacterium]|nr:MarR family transcriptional regulator [Clostridia bacterium]
MIRFDTTGERFSSSSVLRVLGEMAKYKKCTAKALSDATGKSKTTVCRILKYLLCERLILKYKYKSIVGRGAKPDEYFIHPKVSFAVLDLREGQIGLYVYRIPTFRELAFSPKIRADRRMTEKAELIRSDCFDELSRLVPGKYLWSLSVLTDRVPVRSEAYSKDASLYIPDGFPSEVFHFTSEELEVNVIRRAYPDETVLYLIVEEYRREALVFDGAGTKLSKDISGVCDMKNRERAIPEIISDLFISHRFSRVVISSPYLSASQKNVIRSASPADVVFADRKARDTRIDAVRRAIEIQTELI